MSRYASAGGGPLNASQEFKEMVKALHAAGIEVNHVFNVHIGGILHLIPFSATLLAVTFPDLFLSLFHSGVSFFSYYRSFWMLCTTIPTRLMMQTLIPLHFVALIIRCCTQLFK